MIVLVMFLLLREGRRFGISTSFRTLCSIGGGGRWASYFKYDWKTQSWLLVFVLGAIIGGFLAHFIFPNPAPIDLAASTLSDLASLGFAPPEPGAMVPPELFSLNALANPVGLFILIGGGFLIGFGTRWAGGCTSGHAISGLANLQLPSLVAVIGFFIGGLVVTHLLYPILF